jgi:hypothetical protein
VFLVQQFLVARRQSRTIPLFNSRGTITRTANEGRPLQRALQIHCALATALVVSLLGCRTQPYVNSHIESVNAEYRQLEDYVYALEDKTPGCINSLKT